MSSGFIKLNKAAYGKLFNHWGPRMLPISRDLSLSQMKFIIELKVQNKRK